ncbi:MAG: hypothetical protein A3G87_00920 [Omnitrophica bacterium RIFCSPLOWO2_12_FULL_50_11]|nr:MAG: hypothetical protein A3G87_00920 [Omnitrophica bacterium RIFCSPLOWO2_12_FULL_50_11]
MTISECSFLKKIPTYLVSAALVLYIIYPSSLSGEVVTGIPVLELPTPRTSYWASHGENLIPLEHQIRTIEREELFRALLKNRVTFLDIREPKEFAQSHLPNALNIPFSSREAYYDRLKFPPNTTFVLYCNWDFRGYVAAVEMKEKGFSNLAMMYPHGLRGWIGEGLPIAGEAVGQTDKEASAQLMRILRRHPEAEIQSVADLSAEFLAEGPQRTDGILRPAKGGTQDDVKAKTIRTPLRILPKVIEPAHIEASVGDRVILDLTAEEEDHWFVIPDFGVNLHLEPGESRTVELNTTRPGYFPFGCITCCTRYQCKIKQAILVDLTKEVSYYGE